MATYTLKISPTHPTITATCSKETAGNLSSAIQSALHPGKYRTQITGIIGQPETERRAEIWTFGAPPLPLADPEQHAADLTAFFRTLQNPLSHSEPPAAFRHLKSAEIPGIIAAAKAICKKHIPIVDERRTPEQEQQDNDARAAMRAQHDAERADRAAQQDKEAAALAEQARTDYRHLTPLSQTPGKSSHAAGAANLKADLQHHCPGIIFSVKSETYSGGDSIRAYWTDGPTQEAAMKIIDRYQEGSFDGMTDSYTYHHSAFINRYGGAKYTFGSRQESPALILRAAAALGHEIDEPAAMAAATAPGNYGSNGIYNYLSAALDRDITDMIFRRARQMDATPPTPPETDPSGPQDPGSSSGGSNPGTGTTYRLNPSKNGVEIKFKAKPSPETLQSLKASGFRWSKFQKLWYARQSPRTLDIVRRLTGETAEAAPPTSPDAAGDTTAAGPDTQHPPKTATPEAETEEQEQTETGDETEAAALFNALRSPAETDNRATAAALLATMDAIRNAPSQDDNPAPETPPPAILAALKLLDTYTARSLDIYRMAGPAKASARAHLMTTATGSRTPQTESGITKIKDLLYKSLNISGDCESTRENNFREAARAILDAAAQQAPAPETTTEADPATGPALQDMQDAAADIAARFNLKKSDHEPDAYHYSTPQGFVKIKAAAAHDGPVLICAWNHKNPHTGSIGDNQRFINADHAATYLQERIDRLDTYTDQQDDTSAEQAPATGIKFVPAMFAACYRTAPEPRQETRHPEPAPVQMQASAPPATGGTARPGMLF